MAQIIKSTPELVYIMGTGRSGTTILEILLSNSRDTISTGELTHVFRDGFQNNNNCSCAAKFSDCSFWSKVEQGLNFTDDSVKEGLLLNRSLEWHHYFIPLFLGLHRKKRIDRYIEKQKLLLHQIRLKAQVKTIIDSSKYPGRALLLSKIFGQKVKIICLTRSPSGLLNSFKKENKEQNSKSTTMTSIYYCYVLLCCKLVSLSVKTDVYFLKFEELTENPVEILSDLQRWSGLNLAESIEKIECNAGLNVGHIITGNRVRMNKELKFEIKQHDVSREIFKDRFARWGMTTFAKLLGY